MLHNSFQMLLDKREKMERDLQLAFGQQLQRRDSSFN